MTTNPTTPTECHDQIAWLEKITRAGTRVLVIVLALALVFTMVNVQQFASTGHQFPSFQWWIAWLLDPMASLTMASAIVFEWTLASYGRREAWLTATKWFAGLATLVMNVWSSFFGDSASPSGVVLHLVAPGLLLFLAEAAPRAHKQLAGIIAELVTRADQLHQAHQPAPQPAPAPPVPVVTAPPAARPVLPQPATNGHQVSEDIASLVRRARKLPPLGRDRLAKELRCTPHQARLVLAALKSDLVAA
jgi:hypothetical protein